LAEKTRGFFKYFKIVLKIRKWG